MKQEQWLKELKVGDEVAAIQAIQAAGEPTRFIGSIFRVSRLTKARVFACNAKGAETWFSRTDGFNRSGFWPIQIVALDSEEWQARGNALLSAYLAAREWKLVSMEKKVRIANILAEADGAKGEEEGL